MRKILLVDIDGTVADISHRIVHIEKKPKDWNSFFSEVDGDKPIQEVIDEVKHFSLKYDVVFCTGRKEATREKTDEWLKRHFGKDFEYRLLMRRNNDFRSDDIAKPEMLTNAGIKPEDVALALDDRTSVVKKWRSLGIKTFQVADGDF